MGQTLKLPCARSTLLPLVHVSCGQEPDFSACLCNHGFPDGVPARNRYGPLSPCRERWLQVPVGDTALWQSWLGEPAGAEAVPVSPESG